MENQKKFIVLVYENDITRFCFAQSINNDLLGKDDDFVVAPFRSLEEAMPFINENYANILVIASELLEKGWIRKTGHIKEIKKKKQIPICLMTDIQEPIERILYDKVSIEDKLPEKPDEIILVNHIARILSKNAS